LRPLIGLIGQIYTDFFFRQVKKISENLSNQPNQWSMSSYINLKITKFYFMKYFSLLIALILSPSVSSTAQTAHQSMRKGDADYAKNDFKKSEEHYRRALESEKSSKAAYNLGNAIYGQKRYDEAIQQYDDVSKKTSDNQLKFNSFYNKGNAHFWKKEYPKAIESYKNALRLNPNDEDAKKNLALAQRMQKKEEEQKKKDEQNKDKDKKDDKNKSDKDKQQNPNDKDQNQDKKDDKKDDKNPQDKNKQPNQPDQNPKQTPQEQAQQDLKKEEAKRMLQIMDDEERKVQQRLKKGAPRPSRSTKDW
jgi:Ca-activated chloride channel homolog